MNARLNSLGLARAPEDTRVVVAMSGGVDSSVAAALLKGDGYDVVGVTLQLYDHGTATHRKGACCAGQDIHDARRVAAMLDIPHYVLDYEERFYRAVIESFAEGYISGRTPVPCVTCNQTVKFADLLGTTFDLGGDVLATGHYIASREVDGRWAMFRPADVWRDQSYFLFGTTPDQLARLRFPLGGMTKSDVRAVADRLGLIVAGKADSQDICFVPNGRYSDVIERMRPGASLPGEIVHLDGRVLGRHDGVIHFTIGQRRGIGIAAGEPLYVVHIDPSSRTVVVGPRSALSTRRLTLSGVNWLGDGSLSDIAVDRTPINVRVRSTRPPRPALLVLGDGRVAVELVEGEDGVAPGQACVFYDGEGAGARVLGGGWIVSVEHNHDTENALVQLADSRRETAAA